MAKSKSIDSIIAEAEQALLLWEANPTLALSELTLASFRTRAGNLRAEEASASNDLNTEAEAAAAEITRFRSGVRAIYGPDSNQYEQIGGTRTSERKRPARKPKPPAPQ